MTTQIQLGYNLRAFIARPTRTPDADICDDLSAPLNFDPNDRVTGCYPKDFKFTGWHPHCRCHTLSILKTEEEIQEDTQRILNGEEPTTDSVNTVKDVPQEFKDWVKENEMRVVQSNKLPYFITDNERYVTRIMSQGQPSTRVADIMMTDHFKRYAPDMASQSGNIRGLYDRLAKSKIDAERAILINQVKQECAAVTHANLLNAGCVGKDWILARHKFDTVIQEPKTYLVNGRYIKLKEVKLDLMIYKDSVGREFAYPVGAASDMFKATLASDAIKELPPYLSRGIKQVAFLDIPCPADPFWRVYYKNPMHKSMAIDGGYTKFYANPKTKEAFKGYMAHEAGQ